MQPSIPIATFSFFNSLEKNNNRDWFNEHKLEFKAIESEVKIFHNAVLTNLNLHDEVDTMKLFRIYRDVRFSKNKQPYKTHFGCAFHRTKPALRGGYYVHLSPNNQSFLAIGFWEPNKEDLLRIRKEFEMDDEEFRKIINQNGFKKVWGKLQGDEVKSAPNGFNKDHKAIDLIRKKQYIFIKKFKDKEVLNQNFIIEIDNAFKAVRPFFNYMSDILTTNLNGESII